MRTWMQWCDSFAASLSDLCFSLRALSYYRVVSRYTQTTKLQSNITSVQTQQRREKNGWMPSPMQSKFRPKGRRACVCVGVRFCVNICGLLDHFPFHPPLSRLHYLILVLSRYKITIPYARGLTACSVAASHNNTRLKLTGSILNLHW